MNLVVSVAQCLQTSGYILVRLKVYLDFVKIFSEGQALRKILLNSSYKYVRLFEEWQGVSTERGKGSVRSPTFLKKNMQTINKKTSVRSIHRVAK